MDLPEKVRVESDVLSDFAKLMPRDREYLSGSPAGECRQASRLDLDPDKVKNGLGQLVLTLVKFLHELLERQAIRRIEAGSLDDDEIERLGFTLMRQAEEIETLRKAFGLDEDDLNIDLGPLGKLL